VRIVAALGGNALLRRGEPMTAAAQRANVREAVRALAPLALEHELVITHGNGPQVGLLALHASRFSDGQPVGLDVLGAETEGWIGYVIEQELGNVLPVEKPLATILTMVEVDPQDPAFEHPTKPIGPTYTEPEARQLAAERGWTIAPDGNDWRRVVPSPLPKRIFEQRPIEWLLEKGTIVICAGGGGIPTMYKSDGTLGGAEVVIDKDRASSLLARQLDADCLVLATDVEGVFLDWGTDDERMVERASPAVMRGLDLPAGSIGPKVDAACEFVEATGRYAVIGALGQLDEMVAGRAGTVVQG
jgi:carbamate kinase